MQKRGINVSLPLINEANFSFSPDEHNNRIIFSLKGLHGIGDDMARLLVLNRPYVSMLDFYTRMVDTGLIKPAQMVKLIKAGCFVELDNSDRLITMEYYLHHYLVEPCEKLTMQQFARMQQFEMIPEQFQLLVRFHNFKKYILSDEFLVKLYIDPNKKRGVPKCGYNDRHFKLNDMTMPFFQEHFSESSIVGVKSNFYVISEKIFKLEIDLRLKPLIEWFSDPQTLNRYNECLFQEIWMKHANGTISKWEMDSLSFYYSEHELKNLDEVLYGIVNFFDLPEIPIPYDAYARYIKGERKMISKFNITRLAGTVLDSNKDKHTISLLTCYGVVNVKFNKGQFLYYHKTISERLTEDSNSKTVLENSWFKRGNKLIICGYRQDQVFRAYRYTDTIYQHTAAMITEVNNDGTVLVSTERVRLEL